MRLSLHLLYVLLALLTAAPAAGQVELSPRFRERLEAVRAEFLEPVEGSYRDVRVPPNPFLDYDFAIRSRREGLEIRYVLEPLTHANPVAYAPQVRAARLVSHLATNDPEAVISALDVRETDLLEHFNAEWGKVFFFTPKPGFTRYRECKLLALFHPDRGLAYVLFLYDQPTRELDYRYYALRFAD